MLRTGRFDITRDLLPLSMSPSIAPDVREFLEELDKSIHSGRSLECLALPPHAFIPPPSKDEDNDDEDEDISAGPPLGPTKAKERQIIINGPVTIQIK